MMLPTKRDLLPLKSHADCKGCVDYVQKKQTQALNIRGSDGLGQPIIAVGQANIFKRLSRRTTMMFCPSDSIYLKANALLGTGLAVIQSQPS